ncbi:hypothetical protein T492DRAFT_1027451 [Pavlovales sp. CCMP2436]|nr:hypothetical protein T492DRAFT_1027451 [Pavlovales sp. CCMP2436]
MPNFDRDTGLLIPHGSTPASERRAEVLRWRAAFPHLRLVGSRILPPVGWVPLSEVDPRALELQPKQPSAAGVDVHYALEAMMATGALAVRDSLALVGTALAFVPALPPALGAEEEDDPLEEILIASHGELEEVIACDAQTAEDAHWLKVRPELSAHSHQRRRLERWGMPPASPSLDDERLDAATRTIWLAMVAELEPHLNALAAALTGLPLAQQPPASHPPPLQPQLPEPLEPMDVSPAPPGASPAAPCAAVRDSPPAANIALAPAFAPGVHTLNLRLPKSKGAPSRPRCAGSASFGSGALPGAKMRRKAGPPIGTMAAFAGPATGGCAPPSMYGLPPGGCGALAVSTAGPLRLSRDPGAAENERQGQSAPAKAISAYASPAQASRGGGGGAPRARPWYASRAADTSSPRLRGSFSTLAARAPQSAAAHLPQPSALARRGSARGASARGAGVQPGPPAVARASSGPSDGSAATVTSGSGRHF